MELKKLIGAAVAAAALGTAFGASAGAETKLIVAEPVLPTAERLPE